MPDDLARCVAHPARRAVDHCPACARARCAVDAAQWAGRGCPACRTTPEQGPPRRTRGHRRWVVPVRVGLAGAAVAVVGAVVSTDYVGTRYLSLVVPALVGLAASWAVTAAAGRGSGARRLPLLVVAGAAALLGTALGFRLVPGGQGLLSPVGDVAPPYAAAVAGALVWPLLSGAGAPAAGRSRSPRDRWRRQPGRGSDV